MDKNKDMMTKAQAAGMLRSTLPQYAERLSAIDERLVTYLNDLHAPDVVDQNGVFQKIFRNEFGAQGIAGHQHGFAEIPGLCGNMRGGSWEHSAFLLFNYDMQGSCSHGIRINCNLAGRFLLRPL